MSLLYRGSLSGGSITTYGKNNANTIAVVEKVFTKLEDIKEELAQKESQIEAAKEEVLRIDGEIRAWENQHWKMRRNPPSSAILD